MKEQVLDIGIIGAGVMGASLAENIAGRGYATGIYDLNFSKAQEVSRRADSAGKSLQAFEHLASLIENLSTPRKIGLMVNAGEAMDKLLSELSPLMDTGDIIMDMGNSFYKDTQRREKELAEKGLVFFGVGVSGGEKGALYGPSIMAGSNDDAWPHVAQILTDICAVTADGGKCCGNFGANGAGHFVKMIHNGIEYAYMEAIAEIYMILKQGYGKTPAEIGEIFKEWRKDKRVNSYLVEITGDIACKEDPLGSGFLIDKVKDHAGSKGTGLWTSQTALELHICAPVLVEALLMRYLSAEGDVRKEYFTGQEAVLTGQTAMPGDAALSKEVPVEEVRKTLEFIQYICFEQGLKIIEKASEKYGWQIDLSQVISVWKAGCIIRTDFLDQIIGAAAAAGNAKILAHGQVGPILESCYKSVFSVVNHALTTHVPAPVLSSGMQYYIASKSGTLPTAMIQAQRDCFGAHRYERIDEEGTYHTEWQ